VVKEENQDPMNYFQLVHEHRHGIDTHVFKTKMSMVDLPAYEEIAEKLNVDYEPGRGDEFLDLFSLDLNSIKEL
jgi:hypothetical protein